MPSTTRRTVLGTLAAGAAVGVAGCSSSCPDSDAPEPSVVVGPNDAGSGFETLPGGAWPAPRFDAGNTGHPPSRRPPTDPSLRWQTTVTAPRVDGARAAASAPAVADGRVYLATDAGVVALYADDGSTAWRTDAPVTGVPAVASDALFVPTADGLVGLDAGDGSRRWTVDGVDATRPAVADGTVVAGGEETVALDAATGDRRWSASVRPEAHPVAADATVYLGTYEGIVGLSLDDGRERWRVDRGSGRTFSAPVVTPETVYAVERPGEAPDATFALDRVGDGSPEPRWCSYVGEGAVTAAAGGHAFALQSGPSDRRAPPRLVAFTERFGEATWGYATADRPLAPALLDGGVVTVTDRGTVVALGGA